MILQAHERKKEVFKKRQAKIITMEQVLLKAGVTKSDYVRSQEEFSQVHGEYESIQWAIFHLDALHANPGIGKVPDLLNEALSLYGIQPGMYGLESSSDSLTSMTSLDDTD